jgi:hypothetical protein
MGTLFGKSARFLIIRNRKFPLLAGDDSVKPMVNQP